MLLHINYNLLKSWKAVLFTTALLIILYQAVVYLSPSNLGWINSEHFSISNLLRFLIIDQFMVECVTVFIIFRLIIFYSTFIRQNELMLNLKELFIYELKFLPLFLVAFFIFAPFPLTIRFLMHHIPSLDWSIYFSEYFYSTDLYLTYLMPSIIVGYTIINANLMILYNNQLGMAKKDLIKKATPRLKERLFASDEFGELFLETNEIIWIVRENRKTIASTMEHKYRLKETLTILEEKLDPNKFIRINRGTIVKINEIQNYSFWENDKYVVRMKHQEMEFIMSRERLQKVKSKILIKK